MLMTYGLLLIAYLIGAIPFSVIIGKKMLGIDVNSDSLKMAQRLMVIQRARSFDRVEPAYYREHIR